MLNDITKKARALAGQYLQYFVVEFCCLQLKGKIGPAVRAALDPGLYAVFDAMSKDVMGVVSESLDQQGREVFKSLYQDWVRFGKWQGG